MLHCAILSKGSQLGLSLHKALRTTSIPTKMGSFSILQQNRGFDREQERAILCKEIACCWRKTVRFFNRSCFKVFRRECSFPCPLTSEGYPPFTQQILCSTGKGLHVLETNQESRMSRFDQEVQWSDLFHPQTYSHTHIGKLVSKTIYSPNAVSTIISSTGSQQEGNLTLHRTEGALVE